MSLYFNAADTTLPDLIVGERGTEMMGITVANTTEAPIRGARAEVVAGPDFEGSVITIPALPPLSVTQVAFALTPREAVVPREEGMTAQLRLSAPALDYRYEQLVVLSTVDATALHRRTFRSAVDRSAQYYAVRPPAEGSSPRAWF